MIHREKHVWADRNFLSIRPRPFKLLTIQEVLDFRYSKRHLTSFGELFSNTDCGFCPPAGGGRVAVALSNLHGITKGVLVDEGISHESCEPLVERR